MIQEQQSNAHPREGREPGDFTHPEPPPNPGKLSTKLSLVTWSSRRGGKVLSALGMLSPREEKVLKEKQWTRI